MSSSVGMILPNIWKVITNHVPNHQPVDMGELNHQDGDSCNVQRVNQDLSQGQVNSEVHRQDPSRMRLNHDPLALAIATPATLDSGEKMNASHVWMRHDGEGVTRI